MACAACAIFSAGYLSSHDPTKDPQGVAALFICNSSVIKNAVNLNCSFTLKNADGIAIEINEFRINDLTLDEFSRPILYANGTSINYWEPSLFDIKPGDTIRVNIIIPYENNSFILSVLKNNPFEIQVGTPEAQYWKEINV
jgi:hypothetical protein